MTDFDPKRLSLQNSIVTIFYTTKSPYNYGYKFYFINVFDDWYDFCSKWINFHLFGLLIMGFNIHLQVWFYASLVHLRILSYHCGLTIILNIRP